MKRIICMIICGVCLCACSAEIETIPENTVSGHEYANNEIVVMETTSPYIENTDTKMDKTEETEAEYDPETVIDIFQDIEKFIVFDGVNGEGTARVLFPEGYCIEKDGYYFIAPEGSSSGYSLSLIYNNERKGTLHFMCDAKNLKEGDIIHIYTAFTDKALNKQTSINDFFRSKGYVIPITSMDYVTPDLGYYVKDVSEFTKQQIDTYKETALNMIKEYSLTAGHDNYVIDKMYFGYIKPTSVIQNKAKKNEIIIVITWTDRWGDGWGMYYNYGFYIDKDGNLSSSGEGSVSRGNGKFELDDKFDYTIVE